MEQILYKDIILIICRFIGDEKDITYFLSVCKYLYKFKNEIYYSRSVEPNDIIYTSYYDRFTNLVISERIHKLLKYNFKFPLNLRHLTITNYEGNLNFIRNTNITHLYLMENCKINTKKFILPPSLFHLTWKLERMQRFPFNSIPPTLKEICIGNYQYEFKKFPSTLVSIIIDKNNFFGVPPYFFPENLKKLVLIGYGVNIFDLPKSIEEIHLVGCELKTITNFPKNLLHLVLDKTSGTGSLEMKLPLNLKTITITGNIKKLPKEYPVSFEKIRIKKKLLCKKIKYEGSAMPYKKYLCNVLGVTKYLEVFD